MDIKNYKNSNLNECGIFCELSEDNIHEFVTSTYQNYPLEENFKAGNYTLVIDYFKKNFKRLNY